MKALSRTAVWCKLPRGQHGGVAIMFGGTLIVLVAFAGLALDLGRFFVIKAELQNAMDACALSAATQLRPGLNDTAALTRAIAYGRVFTTGGVPTPELPNFPKDAIKNQVNFQSRAVQVSETDISFSNTLNGTYVTGTATYNDANYVKCEYKLSEISIYFMRVLNILFPGKYSTAKVAAMAVATRGSMICNKIPAAICERNGSTTGPAAHGLNKGEWFPIGAKLDTPGWFAWADYSGSNPAGGANDLRENLTSLGACDPPIVGAGVKEPGNKTSAEDAWNTRFGIYSLPYRISDIDDIPPDKTGYSFFGENIGTGPKRLVANWPRLNTDITPRAFDEMHPVLTTNLNFQSALAVFSPYAQTLDIFNGSPAVATSSQHELVGRTDRRLVIAPIANCSTAKITGIACALMLNPFGKVTGSGGGPVDGKLEYLGLATDPNSPCGAPVSGPLLSVLVK